MTDDLFTCPRCRKANAPVGELCVNCIAQLTTDADGDHWRAQWQRELDAELRLQIMHHPNYVNDIIQSYDGLAREFKNDNPELVAAINESKQEFLQRVQRASKPPIIAKQNPDPPTRRSGF